ncbi:MAG: hypothetical protein LIO60_04205 [Oscillospiraceae bacterium]|nr:hypothetical protein [Oscillospiraceae bacterium]
MSDKIRTQKPRRGGAKCAVSVFSQATFRFFRAQAVRWYLYPSQAARFPFPDSTLTKNRKPMRNYSSQNLFVPETGTACRFDFLFFQWNFKKENETKQNPHYSSRAFARKETVRFAFVGCSGFPVRKILPYKIWQKISAYLAKRGTLPPSGLPPQRPDSGAFFPPAREKSISIHTLPGGLLAPRRFRALVCRPCAPAHPPSSSQFPASPSKFLFRCAGK